jgi:AraC family transcriptional regulator, transcriptional activator of pobA
MKQAAIPIVDIDKVIFNFKSPSTLQIAVVPIASTLLTPINLQRTSAPHRTDFYRIIWFQTGNPSHLVDFEEIKITEPSFLFIHKDRVHRFDKDTRHDGKVLIFTDDFLRRTETDNIFLSTSPLFSVFSSPIILPAEQGQLSALFAIIESGVDQKFESPQGETLYHLLLSFLHTAQHLTITKTGNVRNRTDADLLVNDFLMLVERNFRMRLSIAKYAELLNVHVTKLNQAILQEKGTSAKRLVNERLLLEAKRLLVHSSASLKEISYQLGFRQTTNFVKMFHLQTGKTPMAFQKANR